MHSAKSTRSPIVVILLSIMLATPLHAAENPDPWYIGLGFGFMQADGYADYYNSRGAYYAEDGDAGIHVFFGYDLANFSVEFSHGGFAELKFEFANTGGLKVEYDSLSAMQGWRIGSNERFWAYGRAGVYRWEVRERIYLGGDTLEEKQTGNSPLLGLGLGYGRRGDLALRLELDYFFDAGDDDKVPQSDILFGSFSFLVWF